MHILFLDDDPIRTKQFQHYFPDAVCVETAHDCIARIANHEWDIVCLDHDLGGEVFCNSNREDTGMEVVRWLKEQTMLMNIDPKFAANFSIGQFLVHSYNYTAVPIMVEDLQRAGYNADAISFGPFLFSTIKLLIKDAE